MFLRITLLRVLILSFTITQTWCMENDKPLIAVVTNGTAQLVDFKELLERYSKEYIAKTIKRESPSIVSSTLQFITAHHKGILTVVGYGALIATILGLSGSKYYWMTPKKFEALLEKKEEDFITTIVGFKSLTDEAQGNVHYEYLRNFNGVKAGLAVIQNNILESDKEVHDKYTEAFNAELNRRMELFRKTTIASRLVDAGMNNVDRSLHTLNTHMKNAKYDKKAALATQEESMGEVVDSTEKELEKTSNVMGTTHEEEVATLASLADQNESDHKQLFHVVHHTELMAKVVKQRLGEIDENNKENQDTIREALKLLQEQDYYISLLEDALRENPLLPGNK